MVKEVDFNNGYGRNNFNVHPYIYLNYNDWHPRTSSLIQAEQSITRAVRQAKAAFKKENGCTPKEYKEKLKQEVEIIDALHAVLSGDHVSKGEAETQISKFLTLSGVDVANSEEARKIANAGTLAKKIFLLLDYRTKQTQGSLEKLKSYLSTDLEIGVNEEGAEDAIIYAALDELKGELTNKDSLFAGGKFTLNTDVKAIDPQTVDALVDQLEKMKRDGFSGLRSLKALKNPLNAIGRNAVSGTYGEYMTAILVDYLEKNLFSKSAGEIITKVTGNETKQVGAKIDKLIKTGYYRNINFNLSGRMEDLSNIKYGKELKKLLTAGQDAALSPLKELTVNTVNKATDVEVQISPKIVKGFQVKMYRTSYRNNIEVRSASSLINYCALVGEPSLFSMLMGNEDLLNALFFYFTQKTYYESRRYTASGERKILSKEISVSDHGDLIRDYLISMYVAGFMGKQVSIYYLEGQPVIMAEYLEELAKIIRKKNVTQMAGLMGLGASVRGRVGMALNSPMIHGAFNKRGSASYAGVALARNQFIKGVFSGMPIRMRMTRPANMTALGFGN